MTHAALHYLLARRAVGFRLGPDNRRLLLASLALLAGLAFWMPRGLAGTAIGGAALLAWAAFVVRPHEWRAVVGIVRRRLGMADGSSAS
jgi:hypothetical protein